MVDHCLSETEATGSERQSQFQWKVITTACDPLSAKTKPVIYNICQ